MPDRHDPLDLTPERQAVLLRLARTALTAALQTQPLPNRCTDDPVLTRPGGAFVTLWLLSRTGRRLQGCIGRVWPEIPLYQLVPQMAVAAAADPRTPRLRLAQLNQICLEISVLSLPQPITGLDQIEIGRHGLLLVCGDQRSVLLPEVPVERGWDRTEFWRFLCLKAGLLPECLTEPAVLYAFTTTKFGEQRRDDDSSEE